MKISISWLQKYFEKKLPDGESIDDAFTFHAFEVEEREGDLIDLNVLPDRAGYALCHRGIAKELSAILDVPMKHDPLREPLPEWSNTNTLSIDADPTYVVRHMGALIRGVKVGPSPSWLKDALESVGQRSINNVVDILNYVLLDIGQPAGAFDAGKLQTADGNVHIDIRRAKAGETIELLTGETRELNEEAFVFADAESGTALDIAGIKGGLEFGVTETTTDIFLSVGNYDGTRVRRISQALKLFTDASLRYQNCPSPELCAYGMREILDLLKEVAGGDLVDVVDFYPTQQQIQSVSVTLDKINGMLGTSFSDDQVAGVFGRLGLDVRIDDEEFVVTPPFERTDIVISEDLVEEVGRIIGYDTVSSGLLPEVSKAPGQARFRGIERIKDFFVNQGFTEISTQSFAKKGDIKLANPLDKTRPALRTSLVKNMEAAFTQAMQHAPLVLTTGQKPKLFEVGNVFTGEGEQLVLAYIGEVIDRDRLVDVLGERMEDANAVTEILLHDDVLTSLGKDYTPPRHELGAYSPFSVYPFVLRDIAAWVPQGVTESEIQELIVENGGELLVREPSLFDKFEKDGKVSYAFNLVFQSQEKTLTDDEVNTIMDKITVKMNANEGWEVR